MRKWVYLIIGIALIINSVIAIIYLPAPINIFQALWGLLGIFLLWKAIKGFSIGNGGDKRRGNVRQRVKAHKGQIHLTVWQRIQAHKQQIHLTSFAIAILLVASAGWIVGLIYFVLSVITFEAITRSKREKIKNKGVIQ